MNILLPLLILWNLQSNDDNVILVNQMKQTTICKTKGHKFMDSSQFTNCETFKLFLDTKEFVEIPQDSVNTKNIIVALWNRAVIWKSFMFAGWTIFISYLTTKISLQQLTEKLTSLSPTDTLNLDRN